jgi:hypothetical protein
MTGEEIKAAFKKIWDAKVIIVGTMLITGVLDLIGITSKSNIGLGFILGFLGMFGLILAQILKKKKK